MNFIRFCIERPVTVAVGAIVVVLAGLLAVTAVPVQLTPNVDQTFISVTTYWEGASPIEVEREIIIEQEERLRGVPNLVKMRSVARQGEGAITLEFRLGTDKNIALRDVSDRLREVPSYPENVDEPIVREGDESSRDYIAWIMIKTADPDFDVRHAFDFFDDRVKPFIERTPGVSEVNVLGGVEHEAQILVDTEALALRGVTMPQLVAALRSENVNASAGQLPEGKRDVRLRVVGEYESLDQIMNTVVAQSPGGPVYVRDVAEAHLGFKETMSVVRQRGETSMALNVQREPGSNVLSVMASVKESLRELNAPGGMLEEESNRLGLSSPLVLEQVYDQTTYIYHALDLVRSNIYLGGALAILSLLVFLRSWRATLLLAVTIPVSIIGSFVVLRVLGRNVNVISLAGMAFAVGMVLDNAIVVLENIYRRRQMGDAPRSAALRGGREVWAAVVVSTLTTVIVFVPVLTVEQEVGQLFRDIALAICAAVLLSLLAAITIIPAAGARLLRKGVVGIHDSKVAPKKKRRPWTHAMGGVVGAAARGRDAFVAGLGLLMRSWGARIGIVAAISIAAIAGALLLVPPASYLPAGNRNLIFGFLIPPPGYNLDQQIELGRRIERTLEPYWMAKPGTPEAANLPTVPVINHETGQRVDIKPPPMDNFFFVSFPGGVFMGGTSAEETNVQPVVPLLSHAARQEVNPGVYAVPFQAPLFQIGQFGSGNAVELEVSGPNLEKVRDAAFALLGEAFALQGQGVFESVRPDPGNFNIASQEVRVEVDRERAAEVGFTVADVALGIRAVGDGAIVGEYNYAGDRIDLRVIDRRQANFRSPELGFSDLAGVPLATPSGHVVPVSALATMARVDSPQQINRIEGRRSVTLSIAAPSGQSLEETMEIIERRMVAPLRESGVIGPGIETNLAGAASKLQQVRETMLGAPGETFLETLFSVLTSRLVLALVFCYLLMCALFESFLYPLVILVSVPLAMVGGVLGLRIVHEFVPTQQLDTLTMLGFVILIGIVVNNAVLIVAQALNFMRGLGETAEDHIEPMAPREAILESVRSRVRPIMMTTTTSLLGMAPLVVQPGAGSELYRGLGSVVLGGLLLSTVFTLVLCPLLLSMVFDVKRILFGASDAEAARLRAERGYPVEPGGRAREKDAPKVGRGEKKGPEAPKKPESCDEPEPEPAMS